MTTILNAISYTLIVIIILWILRNSIMYILDSISYLEPVTKIYIFLGLIVIILYFNFQN